MLVCETARRRAMDQNKPRGSLWIERAAAGFLLVEHTAYVALGVLLALAALVALAGTAWTLATGLSDWTGTYAVLEVIDRLLFVLMLVEILHTVRASMKTGELTSQPFLVVGLIATIRRVLVITLKSSETTHDKSLSAGADKLFRASMTELAVLALLIMVMVVSIRLLRQDTQK